MPRNRKEPKRSLEHAARIEEATIGSPYRQHGSTHASVEKKRIARQPHRRERQRAKKLIEEGQGD